MTPEQRHEFYMSMWHALRAVGLRLEAWEKGGEYHAVCDPRIPGLQFRVSRTRLRLLAPDGVEVAYWSFPCPLERGTHCGTVLRLLIA